MRGKNHEHRRRKTCNYQNTRQKIETRERGWDRNREGGRSKREGEMETIQNFEDLTGNLMIIERLDCSKDFQLEQKIFLGNSKVP